MKTDKLSELKKLNNRIQNHIRDLTNHGYSNNSIDSNFYPDIKFHYQNEKTSTNIIKLSKGMKSEIISDTMFNRIVCTKGKILITYILLNEEITLCSPNTHLIVPDTKYTIEAIEDSELISVYMANMNNQRFSIKEHETIYIKN